MEAAPGVERANLNAERERAKPGCGAAPPSHKAVHHYSGWMKTHLEVEPAPREAVEAIDGGTMTTRSPGRRPA